MDPHNLKSASKYINNQLAARGLVRGAPIDFAKPAKDVDNPTRIINLVHELVQRRDKEAEQRENLAITIRTLRTTETKQADIIDSLKTKISDLERKNSVLEGQARSVTATLRSTESSAKALRDDASRLRTMLAQVRTQCATDMRKRDLQIQKMKERLLDTRRGTRPVVSTIVIKGGPSKPHDSDDNEESHAKLLSDDTAEFLTKLSQTLADENDAILALLRQCLSTLKAVQGLPGYEDEDEKYDEGVLNPVVAPPANFESLSEELDSVMGSLQEMLNQPNYVPLEDLAERDEEIAQLKTRNGILHEEWRKAIDLVDGWNQGLMGSVLDSGISGKRLSLLPDAIGAEGHNVEGLITNGKVLSPEPGSGSESIPHVEPELKIKISELELEPERNQDVTKSAPGPEKEPVVGRKGGRRSQVSELAPEPEPKSVYEPEQKQESEEGETTQSPPEPITKRTQRKRARASETVTEPEPQSELEEPAVKKVHKKRSRIFEPTPEPEPEPEAEQEAEQEPKPKPKPAAAKRAYKRRTRTSEPVPTSADVELEPEIEPEIEPEPKPEPVAKKAYKKRVSAAATPSLRKKPRVSTNSPQFEPEPSTRSRRKLRPPPLEPGLELDPESEPIAPLDGGGDDDDDDRVIYQETSIQVLTKPPATTTTASPRRPRKQTPVPAAETSKKRRRSSRFPNGPKEPEGEDQQPEKKVRRRSARRKAVPDAEFDS